MANIVDEIMSQAQVYASAWSLVGSRFDQGCELANAQAQRAELRALVERALPHPVFFGFDLASGPDMSVEGLLRADELENAASAGEQPVGRSFSGFVQRVDGQPVRLDWSDSAEGLQLGYSYTYAAPSLPHQPAAMPVEPASSRLSRSDVAMRTLESSAQFPYAVIETPDWTQRTALAIAYDLCDRRGIKHGMTAIEPDVRVELVNALADIIRAGQERSS